MSFKVFNLHPRIESGVKALGYEKPTPIQKQCIPTIIEMKDVVALAQTGTGKTAAFALPILQRLMTGPRRHIRAMIIVPTRELADQVHEAVTRLGSETNLRGITIYGGVNKYPQIKKLREGVEFVVACPGRLLDLMDQGEVKASGLEMLVIDEADRMFDMGFVPEIRKIVKRLPAKRQTLLFSATMSDEIRELTREITSSPLNIRVDDTIPISTVSHALYPVAQHLKTALLMSLLNRTDKESVLVFTRTRSRATRLAMQMKKAGFLAASLQGDLPQNKRREALSGFREGRYQILVATDIAARGIDVSCISHVINYDMPDTVDAYTHRIGRTGRAAKTGDAFSFVTGIDKSFVRAIEKVLGGAIEKRTLHDFDYTMPDSMANNVGSKHAYKPAESKSHPRGQGLSYGRRVHSSVSKVKPAANNRLHKKSTGS